LKSLEQLYLQHTGITPGGVAKLKESLPSAMIHVIP
jgi:hypothetical protein